MWYLNELPSLQLHYWAKECSHSDLSVKDLQASQTEHKLHNAQLSSMTHCWLAARLHHGPAINLILKFCSFKTTMSECLIDVNLRSEKEFIGEPTTVMVIHGRQYVNCCTDNAVSRDWHYCCNKQIFCIQLIYPLHTKSNQMMSCYNASIPILCQNWGILIQERIGK